MSRGTFVAAVGLCMLLGCGGKASPGRASGAYAIATTAASGIPLVVINHSTSTVTELELLGFGPKGEPHRDLYKTNVPPNGRVELRIERTMVANDELTMTVRAGTEILVANDTVYSVKAPLQVDIVTDETQASAATAGFTRDVRLTETARSEKRDRDAKQYAAEQLALCRKPVDAAHQPAKPGKTKIKGTYTCVYAGGFTGTATVKVVQGKKGSVTATVSETGGGAVTNTAWEGILVGSELRFAYKGVDAGGVLVIEKSGRAMSGSGTSLTDTGCVDWTMTCTR